jgi:hypothetical protein
MSLAGQGQKHRTAPLLRHKNHRSLAHTEALAMLRRLVDLWRREEGSATGLDWVLVGQVLVLGSIAAMIALRRAMTGGG